MARTRSNSSGAAQPEAGAEARHALPPAPPALSADDRARLLSLARTALCFATGQIPAGPLEDAVRDAPAIPGCGGVFVTLTEHDELRGCMGSLDRSMPVAESVAAAAVTVAHHDPRFLPVSAAELPWVHVEISVMGDPVPLPHPEEFRPGIDGVIVERGGRRALLLPDVATDQGWGAVEMFDAVSRKAGLPHDAWRDPGTRLSRFRTVRFGGPAVEGGVGNTLP